MTRGNGKGVPPGVDDELEVYIGEPEILAERPDRAAIDAVIKDPQLLSVPDALDREETRPPHAEGELRPYEPFSFLRKLYGGDRGFELVMKLAKLEPVRTWLLRVELQLSSDDEVKGKVRDYARFDPSLSNSQQFQRRATLLEQIKWMLGI